MAAGAADGRVLLLDVVRDCVLAQLNQHAGGVHSLAWVCLPCRAGPGGRSDSPPSKAAEGNAGAGLACAGGQACSGPAQAEVACAAANGWHGDADAHADADPAGSLCAAKASMRGPSVAGGQRLLTHATMPHGQAGPHRTLLASSGADRSVHVYEVCAVPGSAAECPQEGGMASSEHLCSLALPRPPAGLSEAQRGRLWVATAWATPHCGYQELAGAPEAAEGPCTASGAADAVGEASSSMEAGEDAGAGKESVGDESLGGGRPHLGVAASHWLITSSYGGALPG